MNYAWEKDCIFKRKISFVLFDLTENLFHDIKTKEQKMKNNYWEFKQNPTWKNGYRIEIYFILANFDPCALVGYYDTTRQRRGHSVHEQLLSGGRGRVYTANISESFGTTGTVGFR